jgi:GT2 family glycosyltransferase
MGAAPYMLLLNPDAIVDADAVRRGVDLLDRDSRVAAVQGVIRSARDGGAERSQGVEPRPVHLLGRALGARRLRSTRLGRLVARRVATLADHVEREPVAPVDVEYLAATALLVRRSAFDEIGGFDTGYFLYGEDIDLCRRFRQRGWRLVALPGVWAVHENGASSSSSMARELEWWRGTMRFTATWWSAPAFAAALGAASLRVLRMRRGFRPLVIDPLRDRLKKPRPAVIVRNSDADVVGEAEGRAVAHGDAAAGEVVA